MLLILRLLFIALLSALNIFALYAYGYNVLQAAPIATVVLLTMVAVILAPFIPLVAEKMRSQKERGVVKWFNVSKGYGFITREDGGGDVFVHFRSISGRGKDRRSLNEGQQVEFVLTQGDKGPQAEEVSILS